MSDSMFSLAGKTALVTGSSRGIGKAIALGLARAGADIAICARNVSDGQLEAVATEIHKYGRRGVAVQADVGKTADIGQLVKKVTAELGGIDILVNNAGIRAKSPFLQVTEKDYDYVMDVDLKGYYFLSQAVAKKMIEQKKKGAIINISARGAFEAQAGWGSYCIAKAGVVMLTRILARELGGQGIRVNSIAPGLFKTELTKDTWGNPDTYKQRIGAIPLGYIAEADQLVGTVIYLASDASNYVTGHTVLIDGGRSA